MSDEPTQPDLAEATKDVEPADPESWWLARVEPFWVNPATIKGTVALLFGLFVFLAPAATLTILRFGLGGAFLVSGLSDIWFNRGRLRTSGVLREGFVSIGAGLLLMLFPTASLKVLVLLIAIYLGVRGVTALWNAYSLRSDTSWIPNTVRGVVYLTLGAVMIVLPEGVVAGVLIVIATAAIVLGAIMLAFGLQYRDEDDLLNIDAATVSQIISDWVNSRDVGDTKRERISDTLYFEEPDRTHKLASWWIMLLLSVAIATFAILQDSTAVVIGAMLIAPLMTPIMGTAAGIVNGWRGRTLSSFVMVTGGVGASIALAFGLATWVPALVPLEVNSQVTSRISPTLVDMLIALAAGAAGAYATVDDRVSSSITGVAIAVALVPPLGVVGITLQAGAIDDALGAFLLFLTNLVSIILAGGFVLYLTGFAPFKRFQENRDQIITTVGTVVIAALVILIPLVFTAEGILTTAGRQNSAQKAVDEWLAETETLRMARMTIEGESVSILVTGSSDIPLIEDLEDDLTDAFGEPVTVIVEWAPTVIVQYSEAEGKTTPDRDIVLP